MVDGLSDLSEILVTPQNKQQQLITRSCNFLLGVQHGKIEIRGEYDENYEWFRVFERRWLPREYG